MYYTRFIFALLIGLGRLIFSLFFRISSEHRRVSQQRFAKARHRLVLLAKYHGVRGEMAGTDRAEPGVFRAERQRGDVASHNKREGHRLSVGGREFVRFVCVTRELSCVQHWSRVERH